MKTIEKHFPSDPTLEIKTFLNDPKVDGELYALLLSLSKGEKGETRTYKKDIPSQMEIAKIISPSPDKILTRQTISAHFKYLLSRGYLLETKDYYILPKTEKMYFKIPLDTLEFLLYSVKEGVIKTYIYLGQRNSYKPNQYIFTIKEICQHLGLNYEHNCKIVSSWITVLQNLGLIDVASFYQENRPVYRLTKFSVDKPMLKKS